MAVPGLQYSVYPMDAKEIKKVYKNFFKGLLSAIDML